MFALIESIKAQVRAEFGLGEHEVYFYRADHGGRNGEVQCPSCKRYYELLDACPIRMGN
jgi:hypothetical protein